MSQPGGQRVLPQVKDNLLKSYSRHLRRDVQAIQDNFTEILKLAKVEEETQVARQTQGEQEQNEMHVRAANIVRAGESLMKLVSDIKEFLILNDFPSANGAINQRTQFLRSYQADVDNKITQLREEMTVNLFEIEDEYYSSRYK